MSPIDPFLEYLEGHLTNLGCDHLQSKIVSDFRKKPIIVIYILELFLELSTL